MSRIRIERRRIEKRAEVETVDRPVIEPGLSVVSKTGPGACPIASEVSRLLRDGPMAFPNILR